MSSSNQSQARSDWIPVAASLGLFLLTTAVSQWARELGRQRRSSESSREDETDLAELRRWYRSRRSHDRLSYENIHDSIKVSEALTDSGVGDKSAESEDSRLLRRHGSDTEWDSRMLPAFSPPKLPSSQKFLPLDRRDSGMKDMHPNADYDFHPKNRNWRHFEHFNEHDHRKQNGVGTSRFRGSFSRLLAETMDDSFAESDDEATPEDEQDSDDANSISSEGSESSEEQFVWMKHFHHRQQNEAQRSGVFRDPTPKLMSLFSEPSSRELDSPQLSMKSKPPLHPPSQDQVEPNTSSLRHRYRNSLKIASSLSSDEYTEPRRGAPRRRQSLPAGSSKSESVLSVPHVLQRVWSGSLGSKKGAQLAEVAKNVSQSEGLGFSINSNDHHRQMRAQYNARIMPEKVILVRHGQSMGNINELLYSKTPDNAMPLTKLGWEQARATGEILRRKILASGESVHFIVSPYVRTVETFHGIVSAWCDPKDFNHITNREKRIKAWYGKLIEMGLTWNEDSRIREQDFGNYQNPDIIKNAKKERHRFGVFYYRFPHGESASDVFDRVSTFLDSLWRSFEMNKSRNYVLVTHGISIRVLLARYFRYTIDQFNMLANPRNCEMVVLGHNGHGRLELQGRCALEVGPRETEEPLQDPNEKEGKEDHPPPPKELHVKGYQFHKRLRILPKQAIRKVKIRISEDD